MPPARREPRKAKAAGHDKRRADGGKDEKPETVRCISCARTLQPDHTGIVCGNNHHVCSVQEGDDPSCALNFVIHVLSEGPAGIPVKCMDCRVDVIPNTFERNVPAEALATYTETCVLVGGRPAAGERWHRCPFCPLMIVLVDSDGDLLYHCSNCKVASCMVCAARISSERELERHLNTCGLHGALRNEFLELINRQSKNQCPSCGHGGQKDDACTHMCCPRCLCRWCYMCGRPRDAADGGEHSHNADWQSNPNRCPMFMQYIHEQNGEWPDGSSPCDCVSYYHTRKILQALRQKVEEVGRDRVAEMLALFPATFNHAGGAWTIEEILATTPWRNF